MQKKSFLALLLVAALVLSGCSLVVKDPVVDAARVIVDVNGETVDKQTINARVDSYLQQMASYYAQYYGYSIDTTSESARKSAVDAVIDQSVTQLVKDQKIKELGFDSFTDEELASMDADAESTYQSMLDFIKVDYLSSSENEGDALTDEAVEYAAALGYTKENELENAKLTASEEKLRAEAVKDVTVSDDEVRQEFDQKVADNKVSYSQDVTAYGTSVNNGNAVYYAPQGYRYVKQILIKFADDDSSAVSSAKTELSNANTELTNAQTDLDNNKAAAAAEDISEEDKKALEDLTAGLEEAVKTAQQHVDDAAAKLAAVQDAAFANIDARTKEAYTKAISGEDFDSLIEEYNDDPGMKREPGKTNGYAVCAGFTPFETAFVDAAMALQNVGDISEPVRSDNYGYYIIRYESDIPEGSVDLATVSDDIHAELLTTKQDEAYEAAISDWTNAAKVKTYADRLDD